MFKVLLFWKMLSLIYSNLDSSENALSLRLCKRRMTNATVEIKIDYKTYLLRVTMSWEECLGLSLGGLVLIGDGVESILL